MGTDERSRNEVERDGRDTTQMAMILRKWWVTSPPRRSCHHLEEPVHVADRLHRAAVAVEVPEAAREEALPRVLPGPGVMKENLTMLCGDSNVHGCHGAEVGVAVVGVQRHADPQRGNGEGVGHAVAGVGVDDVKGLAVQDGVVADGARSTWPNCWLRRGDPPSYWSTVTLIRVWAGRSHSVVWTHCPLGAFVRYDTQVGWGPNPIEPTVCRVRSTGYPA